MPIFNPVQTQISIRPLVFILEVNDSLGKQLALFRQKGICMGVIEVIIQITLSCSMLNI